MARLFWQWRQHRFGLPLFWQVISTLRQFAVAKVNLRANNMQNRVEVVEAAGFDNLALKGPFDLIFRQHPKGTVGGFGT